MSALAGLVDKELMAPDWAEALAPVDDQVAAMGRFLPRSTPCNRTVTRSSIGRPAIPKPWVANPLPISP